MNKVNEKIKFGLLFTIIQIVSWIILFYGSAYIILNVYGHVPRKMGPANGFGYHAFINVTMVGFGMIALVVNTISALFRGWLAYILLYSSMMITVVVFHIDNYDYTPYKTLHFICSGLLATLSSTPLILYLFRKQND